ncbi:major facilitator superfamily domain-containing protein [Desarmillaria tabescens]|uniref:Major facilitator superfamily domain-containing protein n=1 Tax=Armillaria tabescens TaxID=1929756 RepID=A0AA39JBA3_ARMTA|nr:major facilitator superfamily domain-containing protein [Desarmillaria tabescens]KAK0439463.1 major facilitator superfamily domain-containing protein [Desarmillaria tabescens]
MHKWFVTILCASGIVDQIIKDFGISMEVATLMISLFVAGYCVGPIFWGPLSEEFGRRPVFIGFQIGMAKLADNTASLLIFRFIGGAFAACPLTNSGAVISDIWDTRTRGKAIAIFAVAPFSRACPRTYSCRIYICVSWCWLFCVLTIFAGVCWVLIIVAIPETYRTLAQQVTHVLTRKPMLMASTLYLSFVYGCVYILFEAYPIVFTEGHGFNAGISGLMFLPVMLGSITAVIGYLIIWHPRYEKEMARCAPDPVAPEYRLHMTMYASPLFAVSLLTDVIFQFPSVSYWAPLMAGYAMGFAISWIFLSFLNYIIDTYLMVAASALAANTVCRSLFGAAFPLFATLGAHLASSLLGFIALAMVPLPLLFIKYGHILRMKSKYAPTRRLSVALSKESDKTVA